MACMALIVMLSVPGENTDGPSFQAEARERVRRDGTTAHPKLFAVPGSHENMSVRDVYKITY